MAGYIKIHRSVLKHWVFAHDGMFYLWCNLLLRANWRSGRFVPRGATSPITIERGQLVTGRDSLHAALYPVRDENGKKIKRETPPPHKTTLWRWLRVLEKDGMVRLDMRSHFTIVTICNYDTYQRREADDAPDDAPTVRQLCADSAPTVRQLCADSAPTVRTIEEDKEIKKSKKEEEGKKTNTRVRRVKEYSPGFLAWYQAYPKHVEKDAAATAYGKAIERIEVDRQCNPSDAHLWLLGVTHVYAGSPAGSASEQPGDLQYVPNPSTWLNKGRFNDDQQVWLRTRANGRPNPNDPRGNLALRERMLLQMEMEAEDGQG